MEAKIASSTRATDRRRRTSAPSGLPTQVAERRIRIEEAALRLFVQLGTDKVAMSAIAQQSRCSLQTIYNDYGDKEGLLRRCLASWVERFMGRIVNALQSDAPYKERLRRAFWLSIEFCEAEPEVTTLVLGTFYQDSWRGSGELRLPEVTQVFLAQVKEGQSAGLLRDDLPPRLLMDIFIGIIYRVIWANLSRGAPEALLKRVDVLFDASWAAVAATESAKKPVPGV
ncbi:MAG: TetR/AcrR family transcriptional regulator [Pseudomonadota bacterium]